MSSPNENLIMTPHGLVPARFVIEVNSGESVAIENGHFVVKDRYSGSIIRDHGKISAEVSLDPRAHARKLLNNYFETSGKSEVGIGGNNYPGYAAQTAATNIKSFRTTWTVPDLPLHPQQVDQTYWYLWNGMDGGGLQPVLRWLYYGDRGQYSIANWAFIGGNYVHGTMIPVNPGTELTGVITFIRQDLAGWHYVVSFEGYPEADFAVTRPDVANGVMVCFEAYTRNINNWPPNQFVAMRKISLDPPPPTPLPGRGTQLLPPILPVLNWYVTGEATNTDSGKNTVIVSNSAISGEIDFYFH